MEDNPHEKVDSSNQQVTKPFPKATKEKGKREISKVLDSRGAEIVYEVTIRSSGFKGCLDDVMNGKESPSQFQIPLMREVNYQLTRQEVDITLCSFYCVMMCKLFSN
jgi:hypothetical protein